MKPPPFDYRRPETVDEALLLLHEHGDEAKAMAGGQSLMPLLSLRLARPAVVVDLAAIVGMCYLRLEEGELVLGALARQRDVEDLVELRGRCTAIPEAVRHIGHVAIRNRGTVAGSIAHADPAAEWPALALALDAVCDVARIDGTRTVAAGDLFAGPFITTLEPDELITAVRVPLPAVRTGSAFLEHARRHGDFALAGVAACIGLDPDGAVIDARIALLGVGETARRAPTAEAVLLGEPPTAERFAQAAAALDRDIAPNSDIHASADDRRSIARALTKRVLAASAARAA